jgi:hypothetical protein
VPIQNLIRDDIPAVFDAKAPGIAMFTSKSSKRPSEQAQNALGRAKDGGHLLGAWELE